MYAIKYSNIFDVMLPAQSYTSRQALHLPNYKLHKGYKHIFNFGFMFQFCCSWDVNIISMFARNNFTDLSHQNIKTHFIMPLECFLLSPFPTSYVHSPHLNTQPTQCIYFTFPEVQVTGTLTTQSDLHSSVGQVSSECLWHGVHVTANSQARQGNTVM